MPIIDNIPVWGASIDEGALKQIKTCYYIFGHAALMNRQANEGGSFGTAETGSGQGFGTVVIQAGRE
jgi:hypothetical protein